MEQTSTNQVSVTPAAEVFSQLITNLPKEFVNDAAMYWPLLIDELLGNQQYVFSQYLDTVDNNKPELAERMAKEFEIAFKDIKKMRSHTVTMMRHCLKEILQSRPEIYKNLDQTIKDYIIENIDIAIPLDPSSTNELLAKYKNQFEIRNRRNLKTIINACPELVEDILQEFKDEFKQYSDFSGINIVETHPERFAHLWSDFKVSGVSDLVFLIKVYPDQAKDLLEKYGHLVNAIYHLNVLMKARPDLAETLLEYHRNLYKKALDFAVLFDIRPDLAKKHLSNYEGLIQDAEDLAYVIRARPDLIDDLLRKYGDLLKKSTWLPSAILSLARKESKLATYLIDANLINGASDVVDILSAKPDMARKFLIEQSKLAAYDHVSDIMSLCTSHVQVLEFLVAHKPQIKSLAKALCIEIFTCLPYLKDVNQVIRLLELNTLTANPQAMYEFIIANLELKLKYRADHWPIYSKSAIDLLLGHFYSGQICSEIHDHEKALRHYQSVSEESPYYGEACLKVVHLLLVQESDDEAISYLEYVLNLTSITEIVRSEALGMLQAWAGDMQREKPVEDLVNICRDKITNKPKMISEQTVEQVTEKASAELDKSIESTIKENLRIYAHNRYLSKWGKTNSTDKQDGKVEPIELQHDNESNHENTTFNMQQLTLTMRPSGNC